MNIWVPRAFRTLLPGEWFALIFLGESIIVLPSFVHGAEVYLHADSGPKFTSSDLPFPRRHLWCTGLLIGHATSLPQLNLERYNVWMLILRIGFNISGRTCCCEGEEEEEEASVHIDSVVLECHRLYELRGRSEMGAWVADLFRRRGEISHCGGVETRVGRRRVGRGGVCCLL